MADDIGLFEAIYSQRAIRYFTSDPVPDELIHKPDRGRDEGSERGKQAGVEVPGHHRPGDEEEDRRIL